MYKWSNVPITNINLPNVISVPKQIIALKWAIVSNTNIYLTVAMVLSVVAEVGERPPVPWFGYRFKCC